MAKPIDDMTLPEIQAEIEGMGFEYEYNPAPPPWKCGSLILLSSDNCRFREVFDENTELDAARAALEWLRREK